MLTFISFLFILKAKIVFLGNVRGLPLPYNAYALAPSNAMGPTPWSIGLSAWRIG